jgi:hypothetical protein
LRCGNVHSADGWRALLEPVIARYRDSVKQLYFRGDAAFANPEMYEILEAEHAGYMREKLIKIGAKVVSHGRYVTFQMAEMAVSQQMFADILSLIAWLRAPPAPA